MSDGSAGHSADRLLAIAKVPHRSTDEKIWDYRTVGLLFSK